MGGTQPYTSHDLLAEDSKKDPALEPVADEEAARLASGPQQSSTATQQEGEPEGEQEGASREPALAADAKGEIPSAAEAEDRERLVDYKRARDEEEGV